MKYVIVAQLIGQCCGKTNMCISRTINLIKFNFYFLLFPKTKLLLHKNNSPGLSEII